MDLAYSIVDSDSQRLGRVMLATRDLLPGADICVDRPCLEYSYRKSNKGEMWQKAWTNFLALPRAKQEFILADYASGGSFVAPDVRVSHVSDESGYDRHNNKGFSSAAALPGDANMEAQNEYQKLCRILKNNVATSMLVGEEEADEVRCGLYPVVTKANHSCQPNAHWYTFVPPKSGCAQQHAALRMKRMRALRPIKKGEEILVSYLDSAEDLYKPRFLRRAMLLRHKHFLCACDRCCGTSTRRKALFFSTSTDTASKTEENLNKGNNIPPPGEASALAATPTSSRLLSAINHIVDLESPKTSDKRESKSEKKDIVHQDRLSNMLLQNVNLDDDCRQGIDATSDLVVDVETGVFTEEVCSRKDQRELQTAKLSELEFALLERCEGFEALGNGVTVVALRELLKTPEELGLKLTTSGCLLNTTSSTSTNGTEESNSTPALNGDLAPQHYLCHRLLSHLVAAYFALNQREKGLAVLLRYCMNIEEVLGATAPAAGLAWTEFIDEADVLLEGSAGGHKYWREMRRLAEEKARHCLEVCYDKSHPYRQSL
ncbi:unnamed protein product [Amoebophrya sp. A25]|nr:unnamed protein product [Amoebophrya sp. A25]|eukprot:GSA25T00007538001.1